MLKVGVPETVDPELLKKFPVGIEMVRIPSKPESDYEVEFWVAPTNPKAAREMLPHLHGVRVVQALLAGVDWLLDIVPEGVQLCDAQGAHNISTAEWTVAAILGALKYFPFYMELQRAGNWKRRREANDYFRTMHGIEKQFHPPVLVEELHGKHVLIVGYGAIGSEIEKRLLPFGVRISRVARREREGVAGVKKLHELLPLADVVVLIVPLTPETTGMIGTKELALLKQGALLVNAARGPVVTTDALVEALHAGRIRAALDVTDPEPLSEGHPLWSAPNLLLTPHVAGSSPMFLVRGIELAAEQVRRYMRGEPLRYVVSGHY